MTIGYVGVGNMGGAIAAALAAHHEVHVFDPSAQAVAACVAAGAKACADVAELAAHCRTIFLCLPSFSHVRALLDDGSELLAAAAPGTIIVDQSTSPPTEIIEIAGRLAERGLTLIDAPVSGGRDGVLQGTIVIMIGGSGDQFAHVATIMRCITPKLYHTGPVGSAMMTKVANNYLAALQAAASLQVMSLAVKLGCDPVGTARVIAESSGSNYYHRKYMEADILAGDLDITATIEVMQKDVKLALDIAEAAAVPLLGDGDLTGLIAGTVQRYGTDAPYHAIALTVAEQSNVSLVGSARLASR